MPTRIAFLTRQTADVAAYGGVIATLLGWLPHIAALVSIIWITMQIIQAVAGDRVYKWRDSFWKLFEKSKKS